MRLDLSGCRKRLKWAEKRTQEITDVVARVLDGKLPSQQFSAHLEFHEQPSYFSLVCDTAPEIPSDDLGFMVGDALHNLRSTLDHLAWTLVRVGHHPEPALPRKVEFPLCDSATEYKGRIRKALPGVRGDHRREIRLVQPYHRGRVPEALGRLRDLNNLDKHRFTHPQLAGIAKAKVHFKAYDCCDVRPLKHREKPPLLQPDAELLRIGVTITGPHPGLDIESPGSTITPQLVFDDYSGVLEQLQAAGQAVGSVLDRFDRAWP